MGFVTENFIAEAHLFVTTTPFQYHQNTLVLVLIEDISEFIELRSFLLFAQIVRKFEIIETFGIVLKAILKSTYILINRYQIIAFFVF